MSLVFFLLIVVRVLIVCVSRIFVLFSCLLWSRRVLSCLLSMVMVLLWRLFWVSVFWYSCLVVLGFLCWERMYVMVLLMCVCRFGLLVWEVVVLRVC